VFARVLRATARSEQAALEPLLDRMVSSDLTDLLAGPPSCRLRAR
jgi:hypothetical protein